MLYITGDTHGELRRFTAECLPCAEWATEDSLIVAGDFGCVFYQDQRDEQKLDALAQLPFRVLFLDGNHEAFPAIRAYPEEEWNGGRIHRLRDNVLHLMRGQVYTLEGLKLFTMGGGYSIDRWLRVPGKSWWPEEMPSDTDYEEAWRNLDAHGRKVDFLISHAAPWETMELFRQQGIFSRTFPEERPLQDFLEAVRQSVAYRHYYFGHLHMDRQLWRSQTALYTSVWCLNTGRRVDCLEPVT